MEISPCERFRVRKLGDQNLGFSHEKDFGGRTYDK